MMTANLIQGIVWFGIAVIETFTFDTYRWFGFFWYVMGIFYIGSYFHQKSKKYLSLENGILKQNRPFGKEIRLTELKTIRHFAGDYTLKSDSKEFKINGLVVDKEELPTLVEELKKSPAEWI